MKAKTIALGSALTVGLLTAGAASAELAGNIGVTSNYMWRGTTQTNDDSAIQGGIDWTHSSGAYAGVWTSNTAFGSSEMDYYLGYGSEAAGIGYDVSLIDYTYPQADGLDWLELNLGLSYQNASLSLGYTDDVFGSSTNALYTSVGYDIPLKKDLTLGLVVGYYNFDDETVFPSYTHYGASLSKGDWSFSVSDTDLNANAYVDGDPKFFVSWSKSFDL